MKRPTIQIYQDEQISLEEFFKGSEHHLCLLLGDRGQGKTTLITNVLEDLSDHLIVHSSFEEDSIGFPPNTVRNLTTHILDNQETTGYRWQHLLNASPVPVEALTQLDERLSSLIIRKPNLLDATSDLRTVLKRAIKELFLICSQNLPFPLIWRIDSTEHASTSDISLIKDVIEDPRSIEIKTIISINTNDSKSEKIIQEFMHTQNQSIILNPLTKKNRKYFLKNLYPNSNELALGRVAEHSNGNIFELISHAMESNLGPKHGYEANTFIEEFTTSIPRGKNIAAISSLIGKQFKIADLLALYPINESEILEGLEKFEEYNILSKEHDVYRWVSTSQRAAIIGSLNTTQQRMLNDKIATHFFKQKIERPSNRGWQPLANYAQLGLGPFSKHLRKIDQLFIFLSASEEACSLGEYKKAYAYSKHAIPLVSQSEWINNRPLVIKLFKIGAKSSYIADDIERMRNLLNIVLDYSEVGSADYYDAYQIMIEGYVTKNLPQHGIKNAITALNILGIKLQENVGKTKALLLVLKLKITLERKNASELRPSNDPKALRIGRFISYLAYAAYPIDEYLVGYATSKALMYSIKNGFFPETALGLEFWSSGIIAGYFKNIKGAIHCRNTFRSIEPLRNTIYESRVEFLYDVFLGYHTDSIRNNVTALSKDVETCLNEGEITFASYAAHVHCFHDLDSDTPIPTVGRNIENHITNLEGYSRQNPYLWIRILRQLVSDISHSQFPDNFLEGEYFSITKHLSAEELTKNPAAEFIANHYKNVLLMLKGEWQTADDCVTVSHKKVTHVRGTYGVTLSAFSRLLHYAYKSSNGKLTLIDRCRIISINLHFKKLFSQDSRVARDKFEAVQLLLRICFKRKISVERIYPTALSLRDSNHYYDAIAFCRCCFDVLKKDKKHTLLELAISIAEEWQAPAVENSLRQQLSKYAGQTFYLNPELNHSNALRYLTRSLTAIKKRTTNDNRYLEVAKEIRNLIGATHYQWIPVSNGRFTDLTGSNIDNHVVAAFDEHRIKIIEPHDAGEHIVVIAPVQTQSIQYGTYLLHVENGTTLPPPIIDALHEICSMLAYHMSNSSMLSDLKLESKINNGLFENAAEGLLVSTIDGSIRQFNRRFIEILDLDLDDQSLSFEVIQRNLIVSHDNKSVVSKFLRGDITSCQVRGTTEKGKHVFMSLKSYDGLIHCCLSDITDTIRKSEQDEKLVRQARYFATAVHEIKNPLNTLLGYSNLSMKDSVDSKDRHHYSKIINSSLNLLSDLFSDVISISAINEGRFPINSNIFKFDIIFDIVSKTYSENALQRGIILEFHQSRTESIYLNSDKDRLAQVIRNLISNAIKYAECSKIIVSAFSHKKTLMIHVKDDGVGIPQQLQEKIFSAYNRSAEPDIEGSGLGLYICKTIVQQLGGSIQYQAPESGGSFFNITIPDVVCNKVISPEPLKRPGVLEQVPDGIRVLILDDEPLSCVYLKKLLESHNVESEYFTSVEAGLTYLREDSDFDLIISDLHIRRECGFAFISAAKELLHENRASYALLTGDISDEVSKRCSQEQIYYLSKPVNEPTLLELVKSSYIHSVRITSLQDARNKLQRAVDEKDHTMCELCLRHIAKRSDSVAAETIAKQILRDIDRHNISPTFWKNLSDFIDVLNDFAGESK